MKVSRIVSRRRYLKIYSLYGVFSMDESLSAPWELGHLIPRLYSHSVKVPKPPKTSLQSKKRFVDVSLKYTCICMCVCVYVRIYVNIYVCMCEQWPIQHSSYDLHQPRRRDPLNWADREAAFLPFSQPGNPRISAEIVLVLELARGPCRLLQTLAM